MRRSLTVFPAYAGMIQTIEAEEDEIPGVPRVCGDDPAWSGLTLSQYYVFPAYAGMIPLFIKCVFLA